MARRSLPLRFVVIISVKFPRPLRPLCTRFVGLEAFLITGLLQLLSRWSITSTTRRRPLGLLP